VSIRTLDLADPGYVALMRAYADHALEETHPFDDTTFHKALAKAQGLFLYFSFLVDQIALGRLAVDVLDAQPEGSGLYAKYLADFKRDMGYRRLGEEAELVLFALAAEELAHEWLFGTGLVYDYSGEPLLVGDPDWRGLPLDQLARTIDRDDESGKPTGFFPLCHLSAQGGHRRRSRRCGRGTFPALAERPREGAGFRCRQRTALEAASRASRSSSPGKQDAGAPIARPCHAFAFATANSPRPGRR